MEHITRLVSIYEHLKKGRKSTKELAQMYGVTVRAIQRDVKKLKEAGIPIESENGFVVFKSYSLNSFEFTKAQAGALLIAGKLAEELLETEISKECTKAVAQIKKVLDFDDKLYSKSLERIRVYKYLPVPKHNDYDTEGIKEKSATYQTIIEQAMQDKHRLDICYYSWHQQAYQEVRVDPVTYAYYLDSWYLIAYCPKEKIRKYFRLDKIKSLKDSGIPASSLPETFVQETFTELEETFTCPHSSQLYIVQWLFQMCKRIPIEFPIRERLFELAKEFKDLNINDYFDTDFAPRVPDLYRQDEEFAQENQWY